MPTSHGDYHLVSVLDACSRKIVGWHFSPEATSEAVQTAWGKSLAAEGLLVQDAPALPTAVSDRGTQMTSRSTRRFFFDLGVLQSFSRPRTPSDNGAAESWMATLKCERLYDADTAEMTPHEVESMIESVQLSVSMGRLKSQVRTGFHGSYPVNAWIEGLGWQNERRVRCPRCGSLDTKRHGRTSTAPTGLAGPLGSLQRFLCGSCGRTFTLPRKAARPRARFADGAIEEAVRLYVQGLPSYRVLSVLLEQRLGRPVGRFTLNGWVDELGGRAKTPVEVSAELRPAYWGGFLGVDGKTILVAGEEVSLLVGVDQATHDVVHAVVAETEGEEAFERLVREAVTEGGYPLKGLVSDAAPPFLAAHANYFAGVPLQLCRIHASRRLDFIIPKAKRTPEAPLRAELKERVRAVLFAPTEEEAGRRFRVLLEDRDRYEGLGRGDTLGAMERSFTLYMTHHRVDGMPADANITENGGDPSPV